VDRYRVDLIFGRTLSCALSRKFAARTRGKFVKDFVAAWNKMINLDRFDLLATH